MQRPKHAWSKPFKKPRVGRRLAECIGILMGDGGISRYQVVVSLHHINDREYAVYVENLLKDLFGVSPSVHHSPHKAVRNITISRVGLVKYLHELGLPIGNKLAYKFDMPDWIKQNQHYKTACLRGLVDTDGSVFTHTYRSKGKQYSYKKLSFTSASPALLSTVHSALRELNLHSRKGSNHDVRLDSRADMKQYFSVVGTRNPKHLRRYRF